MYNTKHFGSVHNQLLRDHSQSIQKGNTLSAARIVIVQCTDTDYKCVLQ